MRFDNEWKKLAEEAGDDVAAAMQELYKIYDPRVVEWFANLYDPRYGGYYYSNSARDDKIVTDREGTYGLYVDSESTNQALNFITSSGMADFAGGHYIDVIPDWMKEQIKKYVMGLQDPNGFFYNPQWPHEKTDRHISRRARDLSWCTSMLAALGAQPTYDTPNGVRGSGLLYDGTPAAPAAVTATDTAEDKPAANTAAHAAHLENGDAFRAYLQGMLDENRKLHFYSMGNQLTAEMPQIKKRSAELVANGEESLVDIVIDWLDKHQNPENGLWEPESNYLGVNGLLKISGVYEQAGLEIPNAEAAALSAIDAISSDEPMGAVVDLYNTWFAVGNIVANLRKYGKTVTVDGVELDGNARADRIVYNLRRAAPPAIRKSAEKIYAFVKPDGSYSYAKKWPSSTSQGMPVCTPCLPEGDVNGCVIAVSGIKGHIYRALDIKNRVPMFGKEEWETYLSILEKNYEKCKR